MKKQNEEQEKERTRREYASKGTRSQKMISFRLDLENIEYLNTKPNKGRFINELIATSKSQEQGESNSKEQ